jgi:hypothetical protein
MCMEATSFPIPSFVNEPKADIEVWIRSIDITPRCGAFSEAVSANAVQLLLK